MYKSQYTKPEKSLQERMLMFMHQIEAEAKNCFNLQDPKQKQTYISEDTWKLIEDRQAMHEEGKGEEVTRITKKIEQSARKDKIRHRKETLEQGTQMKEKWQGVKQEKRQFQPSFTKLKHVRGEQAKHGEEASAKAEYLAEAQWKQNEKTIAKQNPQKKHYTRNRN